MDTPSGDWQDRILDACGLDRRRLPRLIESGEIGGALLPDLSARWGLPAGTPVVGGGGDNMCGGVGAGVISPGEGYISLGTSGVYFLANERFLPARDRGMHTHRHAVRGLYCQNAVVLSAAAALSWVARLIGEDDVGALVGRVEAANLPPAETPVFTPYLAGERTPHNRPELTAAFSGLTLSTTPLHLVQAVLEGVALAVLDCHEALQSTGAAIRRVSLIGGGSQSALWGRLIASAVGLPLALPASAAFGPALGAALLARAGVTGSMDIGHDAVDAWAMIDPCSATADLLARKRERYRRHLALSSDRAVGPDL
jgi:xylulokinase